MDVEDHLAHAALASFPAAKSVQLKVGTLANSATPFGNYTPDQIREKAKRFALPLREEAAYVSASAYCIATDETIYLVARK